MAKKNKISDFQKALLNKTKNITSDAINENTLNDNKNNEQPKQYHSDIQINNPELLAQYKQLANYYNIDYSKLIEIALQHFIEMEETWFGQKILDK